MPLQHSSVVGGSTAGLVRKCNYSLVVKDKVPPEPYSIYAATGTALHTVVEECIAEDLLDTEIYDKYTGLMIDQVRITKDMITNKIIPALNIIYDVVNEDDEMYVERKVTFDGVIDGAWGTSDIIFIRHDRKSCGVMDNKFGDGVIVSPVDNDQMRFYLAAAINDGLLPESETMVYEAHIVQPAERLQPENYHSVAEYTLNDLREFMYDLRDAVKSEPEAQPGEHCKYCKGRLACSTFKDMLSGIQATSIEDLNSKQLDYYLDLVPAIKGFIEDLNRHALNSALRGVKLRNYEAVPSQGNTYFIDPAKASRALTRLGVNKKEHYKDPVMMSPTQCKKLMKAKGVPSAQINRFINNYTDRDDNGFRLAPKKEPGVEDNLKALSENLKYQLANR